MNNAITNTAAPAPCPAPVAPISQRVLWSSDDSEVWVGSTLRYHPWESGPGVPFAFVGNRASENAVVHAETNHLVPHRLLRWAQSRRGLRALQRLSAWLVRLPFGYSSTPLFGQPHVVGLRAEYWHGAELAMRHVTAGGSAVTDAVDWPAHETVHFDVDGPGGEEIVEVSVLAGWGALTALRVSCVSCPPPPATIVTIQCLPNHTARVKQTGAHQHGPGKDVWQGPAAGTPAAVAHDARAGWGVHWRDRGRLRAALLRGPKCRKSDPGPSRAQLSTLRSKLGGCIIRGWMQILQPYNTCPTQPFRVRRECRGLTFIPCRCSQSFLSVMILTAAN